MAGTWAARLSEVAKLLRELSELMFPKMERYYGLDSLHRQFVANMKSIYRREEVAALIGDTSFVMHGASIGKKRVAWNAEHITERPMPIPQQVEQMKKRFELFDLRSLDIAQKKAARARERARTEADGLPP